MALEVTHTRFALEFQSTLQVVDTKKYIAGTLYPDSRYVTGLDKVLTHPSDFTLDEFFKASDFRKGWYAHLVCDEVQFQIYKEWFPTAAAGSPGEQSADWVQRSALKSLQDIDDIRHPGIADHACNIEYVETPNGETAERLQQYYRIFTEVYKDPQQTGVSEECEIWRRFGIGDTLVGEIHMEIQRLNNDTEVQNKINNVYTEMVARASKILT